MSTISAGPGDPDFLPLPGGEGGCRPSQRERFLSLRVVMMTEAEGSAAGIEGYILKALSAGLSPDELADDVEGRHPDVAVYMSEDEPGDIVVVVEDAPLPLRRP